MTSKQQTDQLLEVFGFLSDPQAQVRRIALASLLPYTAADKPERSLFNRDHYLEQIATMCADQELIAHDALSALINLTSSVITSARIAKIDGFLTGLVRMIIDEKALLSDLACMLLSNLSKVEEVSLRLLGLRVPFTIKPESEQEGKGGEEASKTPAGVEEVIEDEISALDLLLEVFLKGEGKKYNPNATYDFLAPVFANVSTIPPGRAFLVAVSSSDIEPPLAKLISFTEHPSPIRRGGVASCIKNSAFQKAAHSRLVAPTNDDKPPVGSIDLLPQMLLPLCGPEEFDIDVLDQLPTDLQLLGPSKKREPDANIRLILAETLVLLGTTRVCRESMRRRGVYEVIKSAHLAETNQKVIEPMVRLVNLLMRDEGPDTAIEEVPIAADDILKPDETHVFVSADGTPVQQPDWVQGDEQDVSDRAADTNSTQNTQAQDEEPYVPFKRDPPPPQVDSEDEEEMLLEV